MSREGWRTYSAAYGYENVYGYHFTAITIQGVDEEHATGRALEHAKRTYPQPDYWNHQATVSPIEVIVE